MKSQKESSGENGKRHWNATDEWSLMGVVLAGLRCRLAASDVIGQACQQLKDVVRQAHQQLKEVEAVEGGRAHKRRLQEALLDDWMRAQLVQQRQGGEGHTHEGTARTALPFVEGFLFCSLPAQTPNFRLQWFDGHLH